MMIEGSVVIVLGKLDQRIRETEMGEGLIIGTVCCMSAKDHVWVLLPDGMLWYGSMRDLALESEQKSLSEV